MGMQTECIVSWYICMLQIWFNLVTYLASEGTNKRKKPVFLECNRKIQSHLINHLSYLTRARYRYSASIAHGLLQNKPYCPSAVGIELLNTWFVSWTFSYFEHPLLVRYNKSWRGAKLWCNMSVVGTQQAPSGW